MYSDRNGRDYPSQVSLFGDPRVNACYRLTWAYRSYATSFIAFQRLGIHRTPLVASTTLIRIALIDTMNELP